MAADRSAASSSERVLALIPEPHQLRMMAEALLDTPRLRRGQRRTYEDLRGQMATDLQRLAAAIEASHG